MLGRRQFVAFGVISSAFLLGCNSIPSFKHWSEPLVGSKISDLKNVIDNKGSYASRHGWKEKTYTLENGNWVYVFPVDDRCIVGTEVNDEGVIVNYWTEGSCR